MAINETISVSEETTQIQIGYNVPIECSSQNISIYQKVNDTIVRHIQENQIIVRFYLTILHYH